MTYQFKEYKSPPIKEAIFSISFKVPLTPEQIENFKNTDYVKIKFPIQENKDELVINVIKKEESAANINQIVNKGYILRNDDNLININATQISYHSINKYKGWDNVIVELKDLFSLLSEKNNTLFISQISTRYVNQIILPDSFKNIHEYINLLPNIPKELNPLNNFFYLILMFSKSCKTILTIFGKHLHVFVRLKINFSQIVLHQKQRPYLINLYCE